MCFVINTALRHCNEGAPILTACIFICIRFSFCNLLIMYVFEMYCETQPPASIGWVALSSVVVVRSFVCPASVTSPLISTIWCFRAYKPYIFCEDMILATCQCQHIFCCWVEPSLLLSSSLLSPIFHIQQISFTPSGWIAILTLTQSAGWHWCKEDTDCGFRETLLFVLSLLLLTSDCQW